MSTRDAILEHIRASLGATGDDSVRRERVTTRLNNRPAFSVPSRTPGSRKETIALFTVMLEAVGTTIAHVTGTLEVPAEISRYLREHNLPQSIRMGADPLLAGLPWDGTKALELKSGPAEESDAVSLTHAPVAAAETGTLFLASGADNPTTLSFLPETNIVVIRADDILGSYEEAWDRIRQTYGPGQMPRAVNLVSGPSRTADIEQTLIMGAHGPRRLHVVIAG